MCYTLSGGWKPKPCESSFHSESIERSWNPTVEMRQRYSNVKEGVPKIIYYKNLQNALQIFIAITYEQNRLISTEPLTLEQCDIECCYITMQYAMRIAR